MPIDFYYSNLSPPTLAVHLGLKQLNLDFNIKTVDLMKGEHLKPEFVKVSQKYIC